MTDEGKVNLGDQANTGDDKVEMVAKTDLDKVSTELATSRKELSKVEKELQNAKLELLSPEYVAYLEGKNEGAKTKPKATDSGVNLEDLSRKELVDLLGKELAGALDDFRKQHIDPVRTSVQDLIAREEVRICEKRYDDFNDFRKDMIEIVKKNDSIGIDEAYKIAKANRKLEKDKAEKEAAIKASSEKPGGPAGSTTTKTDFKDKKAAGEDAWSKVVGEKETL
jgi:hypothetical protein